MTTPVGTSLPHISIVDPDRTVLHRALRVALVTPALFAFGMLVLRDGQFALLACFGSFAALAMADFTGPRMSRLRAYGALGVLGVMLVSVGTLLSNTLWPATITMLAVGVVFQFLMVMGGQFALGNNAVILAFVVAVMVPAEPSELGSRLGGWVAAIVVSALAATFVWPRHERRDLHLAAAAAARALGAILRDAARGNDTTASITASDAAIVHLRETQAAVGFRPVGPPEHQRAMTGLVDALLQAGNLVHAVAKVHPGEANAALAATVADTLEAVAAATQAAIDERSAPEVPLDALVAARHTHRLRFEEAEAASLARGEAGVDVVRFARDAFVFRVVSYLVLGTAVDAAVMGGRRFSVHDDFAVVEAQAPSTVRERWSAALLPQLTLRGVWMRNCLRAGVALALAVFVAKVSDIGHAFWVVLATLSVLRGNASTTRATVVSALVGATCGLVLATVAMHFLGDRAVALWIALPFVVFLAGFAPAAVSFGAGQAMFALLVVILFNLIAFEGWEVGVVRVEAVALGAAVALVASLIMWPRGAAAALRGELAGSVDAGARLYAAAMGTIAGRPAGAVAAAREEAFAARERADVAMAAYMGERGTKVVPPATWMAVARVPIILRLASDAALALSRSRDGVVAAGEATKAYLEALDIVTASLESMAARLEAAASGSDIATSPDTNLNAVADLAAPHASSARRNAIYTAIGAWLDTRREDPDVLREATALTWTVGWLGHVARVRMAVEPALVEVTAHAQTR